MFDKLLDLIVRLKDISLPFYFIQQTLGGVLFRFGKFHHVIEPGKLCFKIPFVDTLETVDTVLVDHFQNNMFKCKEMFMEIHTSASFRISDPKTYILSCLSSGPLMENYVNQHIREEFENYSVNGSWVDEHKIMFKSNEDLRQYGIEIEKLSISKVFPVQSDMIRYALDHDKLGSILDHLLKK